MRLNKYIKYFYSNTYNALGKKIMQNKNIMIDLYKDINKKTHKKKENAWQIEIESDKIKKQRRNHKEESKQETEKMIR